MRDLAVDWRMTTCFVLALAAVLSPLLVLFGLKFGVVDELRDRILRDPVTLEVTILGNRPHDLDWFEALKARPDVAFVIPRTRSIAATLFVQRGDAGSLSRAELAELVPTGEGDPLLADMRLPKGPQEIVLSEKLARDLGVATGGTVRGFATRDVAGKPERANVVLTVVDILPERLFGRGAVFAPLELLVAVEDYRDGYAAPLLDWPGSARTAGRDSFASARLYASDLDSVPVLAAALEADGNTVRSRAAEIDGIQSLDRSLTLGFWIIAGLGAGGYFFSLAASLWSNVERKRIPLSVMSLLGMRRIGLLSFPATQGFIIGLIGAAIACGLFFLAQLVVDRAFAGIVGVTEGSICRLLPVHFAIAFAVTLVFSAAASLWATLRVARINPSDGMRET